VQGTSQTGQRALAPASVRFSSRPLEPFWWAGRRCARFTVAEISRSIPVPQGEAQLDLELKAEGFDIAQFHPFDANLPLDAAGRLRATPSTATTKGMFFEHLAKMARKAGVECDARYVPFRDYPMREHMQLMLRYSAARYPGVPLREGLRRVGWEAYPTLMSSIAGRVLFTFASKDFGRALRLAPQAYKYSVSPGTVAARLNGSRQVLLELRSIWNFADCYQVGAVEGGCRAFDEEPRLLMRVHSDCDVDLLVRW
jgi:uncharacterized protein (TIGR02265 family)